MRDCLARELAEEIGVSDCRLDTPLIRFTHTKGERPVRLHVWRIDHWQGEPRGLEGQELAWAEREHRKKNLGEDEANDSSAKAISQLGKIALVLKLFAVVVAYPMIIIPVYSSDAIGDMMKQVLHIDLPEPDMSVYSNSTPVGM